MTLHKLLVFFTILLNNFSYGQDNNSKVAEIDKLISRIDSSEINAVNIGHFIVPRYSDNDTTRLYNRYILDTIKRDFYKCIYDCTFRGLENITFYFIDKELIKVVVKVKEYNEQPFNAIYYFDKGVNIYKQEDKSSNPLWNIDRIKAQESQYIDDIAGIIAYLDNKRK